MGKLYLMTTIVDRKTARKYQELYRESGQNVMFSSLGFGTAASEVLNYLGLEATEKAVLFSVQEEEHRKSCVLTRPEAELLSLSL